MPDNIESSNSKNKVSQEDKMNKAVMEITILMVVAVVIIIWAPNSPVKSFIGWFLPLYAFLRIVRIDSKDSHNPDHTYAVKKGDKITYKPGLSDIVFAVKNVSYEKISLINLSNKVKMDISHSEYNELFQKVEAVT